MDRAGLQGSWAGPEGGHASVYLTSKSEWEELEFLWKEKVNQPGLRGKEKGERDGKGASQREGEPGPRPEQAWQGERRGGGQIIRKGRC